MNWIDASEKSPVPGKRVLAFSAVSRDVYVMQFDGEDWHEADGAGWLHIVTYWMPLPSAPGGPK